MGHQIDSISEELLSVDVIFAVAKSLQWEYPLLGNASTGGAIVEHLVIEHTNRNEPRFRVRPELNTDKKKKPARDQK